MESERPPPPIFSSADNGLLHIHMLRVLYPDQPKVLSIDMVGPKLTKCT